MTRISLKLTAAATLVAMAFAAPASAACELPCKTSKGKMANEWTVSKLAQNPKPEAEASLNGGGGGGKVAVQDLQVAKPAKADPIYLKLGAIKGE